MIITRLIMEITIVMEISQIFVTQQLRQPNISATIANQCPIIITIVTLDLVIPTAEPLIAMEEASVDTVIDCTYDTLTISIHYLRQYQSYNPLWLNLITQVPN